MNDALNRFLSSKTAAAWILVIVINIVAVFLFNDDFYFLVTNVLSMFIPFFASIFKSIKLGELMKGTSLTDILLNFLFMIWLSLKFSVIGLICYLLLFSIASSFVPTGDYGLFIIALSLFVPISLGIAAVITTFVFTIYNYYKNKGSIRKT